MMTKFVNVMSKNQYKDGWQMLMLGIEAVAGRPVPERLQLAFAQSGFLLLTGLTLVLIVRDTSQLPAVQQLMAR